MKRIIGLVLLCAVFQFSDGQDVHFSQFYNTPLNLNPSLTGKISAAFRFTLNYRNQWFSLINKDTPFETYTGSFDMPILFRHDALGVGLVITNDASGEGRLSNTDIFASVAYHKALDKKSKHVISLGVQGGYTQRRLALNDLVFYNQFDPATGGFNTNLPYNESIPDDHIGFFDMNVGITGNSQITEKVNAYLGFSLYHLTEPNVSFITDGTEDLSRRYVLHAGAEYMFTKRVGLIPSAIYMSQRKVDELNLGAAFVFNLSYDGSTYLLLGGYYRMLPRSKANDHNFSDAAIAYTALEYKRLRVGFSFDATTSAVRNAPKAVGAFELSLIYLHPFKFPALKKLLFCPRF